MSSAVARQQGGGHYKDEILNRLAEVANVAQFVSFSPGEPRYRYGRLNGGDPEFTPTALEDAIAALLVRAPERSVNVRSFDPWQPKSHDFLYGLTQVDRVAAEVRRLAARGLHTIVNETIDVTDGGVSGVAYAGVIEFAPDDTPRCVDKPGAASLPRKVGLSILETVYGFRPALDYPGDVRVEFSVHPLRRGFRCEHTIVWEQEATEPVTLATEIVWPNRFSRHLGDKVFGLLVADAVGLLVPRAHVVSRRVAPFEFGQPTETGEQWTRTAPVEQVPGHFTTNRGWIDPFQLLAREDPEHTALASVISQDGVDAAYAGAAASTGDGAIVEGVAGTGDEFMVGRASPDSIPRYVVKDVENALAFAADRLGPVRLEWAHDGRDVWVLQLHRGAIASSSLTIYPGEPSVEHPFPIEAGLEPLRQLAERLHGTGEGVVLVGSVGVTSHLGDVLRRAQVPSRIEPHLPPQWTS